MLGEGPRARSGRAGQQAGGARRGRLGGAAPDCDRGGQADSMLLAGALTVSPAARSARCGPTNADQPRRGPRRRSLQGRASAGSRSGAHGGQLEPYTQGDGASFVPSSPFDEGERSRSGWTCGSGARARARLELPGARARRARRGHPRAATRSPPAPGDTRRCSTSAQQPNLEPPVVDVARSIAATPVRATCSSRRSRHAGGSDDPERSRPGRLV